MSAIRKAEETLRQSDGIIQALLEAAPDAMVVIDPSGKIVLANLQAEALFGYAHEELLGQPEEILMPTRFHNLHQRHREGYFVMPHTRQMGRGQELWGRRKDGTEFPVEISLSPLVTELGTLVFSSIRDITEQKQREAELRLSQHSLQAALDVANLAIWAWDEVTQTKLWTPETKAIFGLPPETEVTRALFRSLIHPDDLPLYELEWARAIDSRGSHTYDLTYRIRRASDGAERWIRSRAAVEFDGDKLIRVMGALRDITEERLADEALRESEERYRYLFNLMDEGYCIIELLFDDNEKAVNWRYLEVNAAFEKHTGLADIEGKWIRDLYPNHEESWFEAYGKVILTGKAVRFVNQAKSIDGSWFDLYAFQVGGAGSRKIAVLFTNITAQKSAEDKLRVSEIRYRRLFETAHDGVLLLDPETRKITDANPYMTTLLGYPHEQLVGKELFEIGLLSDEAASQEMVRKLKETHLVRYEDLPLRSQGGRRQEVEVVANLYDENGHAVIQCNIRDITERKMAQEQIENLNLRLQRSVAEAQHRIKNNLQTLSALVELQLPATGETIPITELKRIGHHIRTLAALHDLMSIDAHLKTGRDTVSLRAALETLIPMLQTTSGGRTIRLVAEEMTISLKQGSSFTLLVNELVSNALKHGQGEITVTLTLLPGPMAQLAVRDQGPGFPPNFNPRTAANTGLELIESMGRWDLRGEVSYENQPGKGAQIILTFPLPAQD